MTKRNTRNHIADYNPIDSGLFGKALECSITKAEKAKASGKTDWTHLRKRYEIKSGAGELGNAGGKLVKNATLVIYVPVPVADNNGEIRPEIQEGFVLTRENFLLALTQAGAIREKTATNGTRKITIQTFWNRTKNAPHGKLYERILDAMYEYCNCTLEELCNGEA